MKTSKNLSNFSDIVFEQRNKEYGAYALKKLYNKYVSLSATGAIIIFSLIVSYPLITAFFIPESNNSIKNENIKVITFENIMTQIPNDKNAQQIPKTVLPKTPSVKFVVPKIKPDELASNEVIPTQEELSGKNPGNETIEGNPNGTDVVVEIIELTLPEDKPVEKVYTWLEEMPLYPGGDIELMKFFSENLVYPEIAKRAGVEGRVILSFVVDKNGNIIDVEVAKSIGAGCDEEAMRVLKIMPHWIPGKQNGNPVFTRINLPVVFKLRS
jgi:protein TonB